MGNLLKFFLILGLISKVSFAGTPVCKIKFYQKVFYLNNKNSIPIRDLVEKSNCSQETQKKIGELVLNSQDLLTASYLEEAFNQYSPKTPVKISPEKFELKYILSDLELPKNWIWQNLKILRGNQILHGNQISIICSTCNSLGKKAIEIKLDNNTLWAEGELMAMTDVLVSLDPIPSNRETLLPSDFKLIKMPLPNPDDYFISLEEIKYYKLNLNLPKGVPLKKSNLRKIDLIRPGVPVKLNFNNNGLSIKSLGMPMSTGKIGELIKIKNQKTNTVIFGKVIGENNVSVDL